MYSSGTIVVTNTITPHDLSILILITLFCGNVERISPKVLFNMIPPVNLPLQDTAAFNIAQCAESRSPLKPTLHEVIQYLLDHDHRQPAMKLLVILDAITNLNGISRLFDVLNMHCLRTSFRKMDTKNAKGYSKTIDEESVFGSYVERCVAKHICEDFQDSEKLWISLFFYRDTFKSTELYKSLINDLPVLDSIMSSIIENRQHNDDFESFKELQDTAIFDRYAELVSGDDNVLMISKDHLQAILSVEMTSALRNGGRISPSTKDILKSMSLEDRSRFPSVHILKYLEAMGNQEYDNSLEYLYRYFDYMLGQNSEHYFHMSLLSLATFHGHFNNDDAAVKTFEEAIAVARENKDITTLNLILIWVFEFIKKHPDLAHKFHVTTEQIINYLKTCPDSQSSIVFEKAYKFESLWTLLNSGSVPAVLEALFKSSVIALQSSSLRSDFNSTMKHNFKIWEDLGFPTISKAYRKMSEQDGEYRIEEINQARKLVKKGDFSSVHNLFLRLESPAIDYEERRNLQLLKIEYLGQNCDYHEAIKLANIFIKQCQVDYIDSTWEFNFTVAKCHIMIASGLGSRCMTIAMAQVNNISQTRNALNAAILAVLLSRILHSVGKYNEALEILDSNVHGILQFSNEELQLDFFSVYLACCKQRLKSTPKISLGITVDQLVTLEHTLAFNTSPGDIET